MSTIIGFQDQIIKIYCLVLGREKEKNTHKKQPHTHKTYTGVRLTLHYDYSFLIPSDNAYHSSKLYKVERELDPRSKYVASEMQSWVSNQLLFRSLYSVATLQPFSYLYTHNEPCCLLYIYIYIIFT